MTDALLVAQECGTANDIDEEDVRDLELGIGRSFSGHSATRAPAQREAMLLVRYRRLRSLVHRSPRGPVVPLVPVVDPCSL